MGGVSASTCPEAVTEVRTIPVQLIDVLNPRERNDKVFDEIVVNIKRVGLKKPITVTPRRASDGSERYLLVCGEGRLKAFKALGETSIPAIVVQVSDEDAFIMSLAENIARRQCRPLELLSGIEQLQEGVRHQGHRFEDRPHTDLHPGHPDPDRSRRAKAHRCGRARRNTP